MQFATGTRRYDSALFKLVTALLALGVSLILAVAFAGYAHATTNDSPSISTMSKAKKNLKQRGVKFDLKEGKEKTTYMMLKGYGKVKYTVKLSNLKIKKATKKGYKQATFKVTWALKTKLTQAQINKVSKAIAKGYDRWSDISGGVDNLVLDYTSGMRLDVANDYGVKAKLKNGKIKYTELYEGSNHYTFDLFKGVTAKYTITYPKEYKNLCFGAGGVLTPKSDLDSEFLDEPDGISLLETSLYKKKANRNNIHFIRIV